MKKFYEDTHICKNNHEFHWKKLITDESYIGKMDDINLNCIRSNETKENFILTIQCPICYSRDTIYIKKETTK